MDTGFTHRWRVRMPQNMTRSRAVSVELCIGPAEKKMRFFFFMGRDDQNLTVWTWNGKEAIEGKLQVKDPGAFHLWTFIFDGAKNGGKGVLYVDDKPILSGIFDHHDVGDAICFGSKAEGIVTGNWNLVEFYATKLPAPGAAK